VVISQVYGGGGNSSATYQNDFVELHNNSGKTANIGGWAVGYQSNAGTTWSTVSIPANTTMAPGGYYLIQLGPVSSTGAALSPDLTGPTSINMAAGQGKVILVSDATVLSAQCPAAGSRVDVVQWGSCTKTCFEGTTFAAAASNNVTSTTRGGTGCTDTDSNSTDFSVVAVTPHNSTTGGTSSCSCTLNESNQVLEADFCTLNTTTSLNLTSGTSTGAILGELYESGITDGGQSAWVAQVGYGPSSVNPEWQSGWTWFTASYVGQTGFGGHDNQFSGSFNAPASGSYRYTYRVSSDGTNWTYCDANGAGSNASQTFEVTQLPTLTVP
jgi:hypothetical protein